ncbi:hypothetical protein AB0E69_00050 [Kribbella sp. NPDC026611]|uniref:hypothetical protein n=1 Tax=Kribbella sp. NPDC026611 TaxID=3154911 RepID=UPI0033F82BDA
MQTVPLIGSTNLLATLDLPRALTLCATATTFAGLVLLRLEPVIAAERRTPA